MTTNRSENRPSCCGALGARALHLCADRGGRIVSANPFLFAACAGFLLAAIPVPALSAPEAAPAALIPSSTIASSDNSFEISAVPATKGYRGPVLFFVDNFRREFLRATHLEFGRIEHPIAIRLGSSTNDERVIGSFAPGVTGGEREYIDIPDPEHADFERLRTALAQALVREWQRSLPAPRGERKPPQDPPAWLIAGVARQVGGEHRLEDFDLVHEQWQRGRLPLLADLLAPEPPAALRHPALPAVLAAWLLDRPDQPFAALLRRLSEGTPWSPELVAEVLDAKKDPAALNGAWDAWQTAAVNEVRQVGVTTPGVVRAFRAQLLVYPGDCSLPLADAWRGRSFDECLAWPATPEVQAAMRGKAVQIRIFAAGRDGALQRVATAYAAFLDALARGEAQDKLRTLLGQAEEGRRQLEARAAKGEILRDPVPETPLPSNDGRKARQPSP